MKKIALLFLAAALLLTSFIVPAVAFESSKLAKSDSMTEHNRHRRHHRRRGHGSDWVGFGIGAALGIIDAVTDDEPSNGYYYYPNGQGYYHPQGQGYYYPQGQTLVYDPACNCYYYR